MHNSSQQWVSLNHASPHLLTKITFIRQGEEDDDSLEQKSQLVVVTLRNFGKQG